MAERMLQKSKNSPRKKARVSASCEGGKKFAVKRAGKWMVPFANF
jgi:hypothetical protein